MLYSKFHSQINRSAFSWKRFHIQGPIPGAAPMAQGTANVRGVPTATTMPVSPGLEKASQVAGSAQLLWPLEAGRCFFFGFVFHFRSLVLCHGPACMWCWGWFGCISFIGAGSPWNTCAAKHLQEGSLLLGSSQTCTVHHTRWSRSFSEQVLKGHLVFGVFCPMCCHWLFPVGWTKACRGQQQVPLGAVRCTR